jgi:hypothetical protein
MTEVAPVDLELGVVVHVHELVHDGVFHVAFAEETTLTEHDRACIRAKAASFRRVAGCALDVGWRDISAVQAELLEHEHNSRTYEMVGVSIEGMTGKQGYGRSRGRTDDTDCSS